MDLILLLSSFRSSFGGLFFFFLISFFICTTTTITVGGFPMVFKLVFSIIPPLVSIYFLSIAQSFSTFFFSFRFWFLFSFFFFFIVHSFIAIFPTWDHFASLHFVYDNIPSFKFCTSYFQHNFRSKVLHYHMIDHGNPMAIPYSLPILYVVFVFAFVFVLCVCVLCMFVQKCFSLFFFLSSCFWLQARTKSNMQSSLNDEQNPEMRNATDIE